MRVNVFIFNKFQGAQILLFFCENWHVASFYNEEQTQKYKFEIWLLKSNIFSIFENTNKKKTLLTTKNSPNGVFDGQ